MTYAIAAPLVGGLVAYFRGLQNMAPSQAKSVIAELSRNVDFHEGGGGPPTVWNGQIRPMMEEDSDCDSMRKRGLEVRQSCQLPGGGGNGQSVRGPPVSYKPGPPAPLCTANCGHICDGYYCRPNPT